MTQVTLMDRYKITQKDGDADPESVFATNDRAALDVLARRAGNSSYAAACQAAGLSVAQGLDRITVELVESVEDYLTGMIDDDMRLAELLRYVKLRRPQTQDNYWIFGINTTAPSTEAGPASGPLPRWRRDAHAMGDLLERLPMSIDRADEAGHVNVRIEAEGSSGYGGAYYRDHPSIGHAIRKAMVMAAIEFLTIAKESRNA